MQTIHTEDITLNQEEDWENIVLERKKSYKKVQQQFDDTLKILTEQGQELGYLVDDIVNTTTTNTNLKVWCLVKPVQTGKTKFMIEMGICKTFTSSNKNVISIIFCDNNLLLTNQTLIRINEEETLYRDSQGDKVLEFSSKSKIKKTELEHYIRNGVKIICMCSNGPRMKDINWLLQQTSIKSDFKFEIWIDEADKYVKSLNSFISEWSKFSNVKKLTLMTATPEKVLSTMPNISVIPLDSTYDSDKYLSFKDCHFEFVNEICSHADYIKTVLEEHPPENGQFWFVPANTKKKSHYEVRDLLKKHGFNVLVINSDGKMFYDDREGSTPIDKKVINKEVNKWLPEFYNKMNLSNQKFAVTGNFCIGRGITIQSERLMITHCAYPPVIRDKSAAYQMQRTLGMIKHLQNFVIPTVYCSQKFKEEMMGMEHAAMELGKLAKEKPHIDAKKEYQILKKEGSKSLQDEDEYIGGTEWFDTKEEVKRFYKEIGKSCREFKQPNEDGFELGSISRRPEILTKPKLDKLSEGKKTANLDIRNAKIDRFYSRLYPYYTNINDNTTLKYCVRWVKKVKELSTSVVRSDDVVSVVVQDERLQSVQEVINPVEPLSQKRIKRKTKTIDEQKKKERSLGTIKM